MKPMRLLVVDDEKEMRQQLISLLSKHPEIEIVATATNGKQALKILEEGAIDAVFLDVEMPELNGLEVAATLSTWPHPPQVIFATAYSHYAVAAFEANAIDYILKPYRTDRVSKAIQKLRHFFGQKKSESSPFEGLNKSLFEKGLIKKMIVRKKNSKDKIVIDPVTCDYFHAKLAEVFAHIGGQDYVVNMTLKELCESLMRHDFAQCHKAYLVNLAKVEKITPLFNHTFDIFLKSGSKIPLSRNYAKTILEKVGG